MNAARSSFTFIGYKTDFKKGVITFSYELSEHKRIHEFKERIIFPSKIDENLTAFIRPILDTLLLMLGISYWKAFCPKDIIIRPFSLSREQANFWNLIYTKGLGELYYKNHIDFRGLVQFPYQGAVSTTPVQKTFSNRSLVLLGGGKDSIVTVKLLESHHKQFSLFALNPVPLQNEIASKIGSEYITVKRELDPKLFELNKDHVYNGHIPISAIYASVSLLAAAVYDYRYVVTSNEASANIGNVEYLGQTVNHQWSKSFEFEQAFSSYLARYVTSDILYFSLLRPIHETHIVKLFTNYSEFFPIFSSCNNNFKLSGSLPGLLWCGKCPKCAFVFLLLAAFLPKAQVVTIFGKNLFADASLTKTYRELLGIEGFKPFECVGTPEESQWAFQQVMKRNEFTEDVIIKRVASTVHDTPVIIAKSNSHAIPKEFQEIEASL